MTQEAQQLGAILAVAIALIELVKFIISKYTGNDSKLLEQVTKMNNNHLTHLESAIREQTKLFQEDHNKNIEAITGGNNKNLEVLFQIKAGVDQLNKR